jgi:glycosyltransferase involved in cell wall biosynthesis
MDTLLSKRFSNINKRFTSLIQKIGLNRSVDLNIDTNYSVPELDLTKSIYTSKKFLDKAGFMPDVIIVLFMQNFVTCKNLYELNKLTGAPVILYFMDMAPMTGLCHYAWDCLNYQFECGNCPALHSTNADDISSQNFIYKKKYIGLTDLKLVSGCEYLVRQLKKSSLFKHLDVSKIFVPVMTGNKNNETPEKIKQMFNLPTDKKIIFIGANSVTNKRKGIKYLLDALSSLYRSGNDFVCNQIHIAVAGNSSGDIISQIDFPCTSIGHLKQDRLNLLYSGVDLFVSPSIEDSGPMMVNQAIISGTPVVAFAMGVAIDLVISGKTGYLAELKNV